MYPIHAILVLLASIKIDLSAIKVTCPGATMPVNLLIDYLLLGAVIVVCGTDYQLFRATVFTNLQNKFVAMVLTPAYFRFVSLNEMGKCQTIQSLYECLSCIIDRWFNRLSTHSPPSHVSHHT